MGTETAGQLLITAGDNPDRLRSEASFAHLCEAAPIPASSGRAPPAPHQPRRRPQRQQRPLHHRPGPHAARPTNPGLRRQTHRRGHVHQGHHALSEEVRRP
ncbi:hypothetical protein [Streptomyces sp. NPDC096033]|uniref:hypothetical protein n=1 Tax=Streptomyces sp. NPDC096033 TaxID=3366071 RepID=UPI0037FC6020